jgi:hypothetical protein
VWFWASLSEKALLEGQDEHQINENLHVQKKREANKGKLWTGGLLNPRGQITILKTKAMA